MRAAVIDYLVELDRQLLASDQEGLSKTERLLLGRQGPEIAVRTAAGERTVLNLCSNDYLGLARNEAVCTAASKALKQFGLGMASVRFICGTQELHRRLEAAVAAYLRQDDAILFAACFDANAGAFEPLLGPDDAVLSDSLNHASIIDGIRLCKAHRYRYTSGDMDDLERKLRQAQVEGVYTKLIVTDGVFSMEGRVADLEKICDLADRYGALVMVDDCHATGVLGRQGRGSAEHCRVEGRVDIVTGTFGKALGGAMGGFVAGRRQIVATLRQCARPYLFSNSLSPPLAAAALTAIERAQSGFDLRRRLVENARQLRGGLERAGFSLLPGEHPIVPVMIGDARLARDMTERLLGEGVYVTSFSYPVVPQGQARIRTQMSAAHTAEQIDLAVKAFAKVGTELGIV